MRKSILVLALLVWIGLGTSGCVSGMLAKMAVKAPNQQRAPRVLKDAAYAARCDAVYAQAWRLRVGPPAAELSVAVVEPGNYEFTHKIELHDAGKGRSWLVPKSNWTVPPADKHLAAKATVLVLHGYMDSKEDVLHWALCLAEMGYRCVLVDFRGHGRSGGDWIGFGAFEVRDLSRVIDDLEKRGLVAGKVGVVGVSYGGSIGLQLAARDARIGAVAALEAFSDAEKAVVEFAHGVAPQQAKKISAATFAAAVRKAPKLAKFWWDDTRALADAERVTVPTLFIHGAKDTWTLPEHSRLLNARVRGPSRLIILENDEHLMLSMRLNPIAHDVRALFDEALAKPKRDGAKPDGAAPAAAP